MQLSKGDPQETGVHLAQTMWGIKLWMERFHPETQLSLIKTLIILAEMIEKDIRKELRSGKN